MVVMMMRTDPSFLNTEVTFFIWGSQIYWHDHWYLIYKGICDNILYFLLSPRILINIH